jgi:dTMP kinase
VSRGVFITFEGTEGCGKSTQVKRLRTRLENLGFPLLATREPGGTPIGESIRELLQFTPHASGMTAETELLLFEASRAQLVREVIKPSLDRGMIVVSDRFYDSTTVYQGAARKLERAVVEQFNRFAVENARPDITFVLDVDLVTAGARLSRTARPADRMEQQPDEFYEAVRAGYHDLAERESRRVVLLDGSKSADAIEAQVWNTVTTRFPALATSDTSNIKRRTSKT